MILKVALHGTGYPEANHFIFTEITLVQIFEAGGDGKEGLFKIWYFYRLISVSSLIRIFGPYQGISPIQLLADVRVAEDFLGFFPDFIQG